jgi:uncharacterized membrane protein
VLGTILASITLYFWWDLHRIKRADDARKQKEIEERELRAILRAKDRARERSLRSPIVVTPRKAPPAPKQVQSPISRLPSPDHMIDHITP